MEVKWLPSVGGVRVVTVDRGGLAQQSDLLPGDIIYRINGVKTSETQMAELSKIIRRSNEVVFAVGKDGGGHIRQDTRGSVR